MVEGSYAKWDGVLKYNYVLISTDIISPIPSPPKKIPCILTGFCIPSSAPADKPINPLSFTKKIYVALNCWTGLIYAMSIIGQRRQLAESHKDKCFSLLHAHKLKIIIFFVIIFMAGLTAIHLLLLVLLFFLYLEDISIMCYS